MTSRYIKPELMANPADAEFARIGGTLPEGHQQYDYDGDFNAEPVPQTENTLDIIRNMYSNWVVEGRFSQDMADDLIEHVRQKLG